MKYMLSSDYSDKMYVRDMYVNITVTIQKYKSHKMFIIIDNQKS